MVSSSSIDLTNIQIKNSDRFFFDRYQFAVKFVLPEAHTLRDPVFNLAIYHHRISNKFHFRKSVLKKFNMGPLFKQAWSMSEPDCIEEMSDIVLKNLLALAEVLCKNYGKYKLVVCGAHGYIYSNDLNLLSSISQLPYLSHVRLVESRIIRPKNSISLQFPKHNSRTYFRNLKLGSQETQALCNFLAAQQDIRCSPSLQRWIELTNKKWAYATRNYWFIDHSSDSILLVLEMLVPKILRCTVPIIKVNN